MKPTFLIACLFVGLLSIGQAPFALHPSGLKTTSDTTKSYLVIEDIGASKGTLFSKYLLALSKLYISPKDVISKVDSELISVNAVSNKIIHGSHGALYEINYTLQLSFKDGKVKIDAPELNKISYYNSSLGRDMVIELVKYHTKGDGTFFVFMKNGKVASARAKEEIEKFSNDLVKSITDKVQEVNSSKW